MSGRRNKNASPMVGLVAFFAGLLLGSLTGAVVMLLVAPRKGEKTRAQILKKGEKLRHQAADGVDEVLSEVDDRAHQFADSVQVGVTDLQQNAQDLFTKGKK